MFHLLSYVWHVFVRHRHVWFAGLGFVMILGVSLHAGMRELNASLTKHYEKVRVTQQPSARELRRIRRMQRLQARMERSTLRAAAGDEFPLFSYAVHPVDKVPDWGAMRTPAEWSRSYQQMTAGDFVPVPPYDLDVLTIPMSDLLTPLTPASIPAVTAKLYYSTRFFSAYDVDSDEFTGKHAGVDLKLPMGTPVGSIGGGRVVTVEKSDDSFGMFVMIEHHLPEGAFFSIYAHLGSISVKKGQDVEPGQQIGTVGMTGKTTAPHLHLQIDRGQPAEDHIPYRTSKIPSPKEADQFVVHPINFIRTHAQRVALDAKRP